MKVTYSWLKNYVNLTLSEQETSQWLTDCGLEIDGVETYESVKGGLKGLIIGEVLTCVEHPNSDHLHLTTVNIGNEILSIVCGASNIAAGQKVVVATIGTVLYSGEESFIIKKSKIRGEESFGMICAEDEIGVGNSHDGIMVLPTNAIVGTPAAEYFNVTNDTVFEIGLTPNRCDATSHIGVARDLAAMLQIRNGEKSFLKYPSVDTFVENNTDSPIKIEIENPLLCPRYTGLCLKNVKVKPSPSWLQERLKSVGIRPINNVVDVTNFVLMETGQPMHAFDQLQIKGGKVVVRNARPDEKLTTLDGIERKLSTSNLMICNTNDPMCIAGVFGGEKSGVSENTTDIFLESAYFNAVSVRKTAREHSLNTDASFRYERGADPNITVYAIKRAALLLEEIAEAKIAGSIVDLYPKAILPHEVVVNISRMQRLIGKAISKDEIIKILQALEMEVKELNEDSINVSVPTNKVDVIKEADITEEVLRIYGYNRIETGSRLSYTLNGGTSSGHEKIVSRVSDYLSDNGFYEVLNNSLCKLANIDSLGLESLKPEIVSIANPLSQELNMLRPNMLFGGLESLAFNINHKQSDLKLYEFGRTYKKQVGAPSNAPVNERFSETQHLCLWICGMQKGENWLDTPTKPVDFYFLKENVEKLLRQLRLNTAKIKAVNTENALFSYGLEYFLNEKSIVCFGKIKPEVALHFDIKTPVFYADFQWDNTLKCVPTKEVVYTLVTKFPEVRRDLALLLNKDINFNQIESIARSAEKQLLKQVCLFDVYEGKNLPDNKKSYAVSFILQDPEKTLTDKQIEKTMDKIFKNLQEQLKAELR